MFGGLVEGYGWVHGSSVDWELLRSCRLTQSACNLSAKEPAASGS